MKLVRVAGLQDRCGCGTRGFGLGLGWFGVGPGVRGVIERPVACGGGGDGGIGWVR